MRLPRKWVLSLGLMAAAPGVTLANPFAFLNPDGAQEEAVSAAPRSNQDIANDVASALTAARLQGQGIEIEVQRGVCVLKGQIADLEQKATATRIISEVDGVEMVDNQLTLMEAAGAPDALPRESAVQQAGFTGSRSRQPIQQVSHTVDNQQMAQQIADAVASAGLRGYDIEIRYKQGVASLIGDVGSRQEAVIAERAAQQVAGVNRVLNELTVDGQRATPQVPQGYPGRMPQAYPGQAPQGYPGQMPQQGGPQPQGMPYRTLPAAQTQAMPAMAGAGAPMQQAGHLIHNRPSMPEYAWPSYAAYDNYAQVTYPSAYDASAWPYIGPFYPYPQVPLGWREASLEWDDGHWQLMFNSRTDKWWWFLDPGNWHE
jgi:osmotically-inducible protein OsmY